jgi:hypothetical protein
MGARELLDELAGAGFTVAADGDNLVIRPASKLTDDQRAAVRAAKPDLLTLLAEREPATEHSTTAAPAYPPPDVEALHTAYAAHHWRCVHCIAAGRMPGKFERCPTGRLLWDSYTAASESTAATKGRNA